MDSTVFFQGWGGLLRVVVAGVLGYTALVLALRVTGKRALGKLNAFDLVVSVALGSTLASLVLNSSVALAEGVTAFVILLTMQYLVTFLSVRSTRVARLVRAEPTLLFRSGFLAEAMRQQRVTEDELRQAARSEGHADLDGVAAILIEADGTLSVLTSLPDHQHR